MENLDNINSDIMKFVAEGYDKDENYLAVVIRIDVSKDLLKDFYETDFKKSLAWEFGNPKFEDIIDCLIQMKIEHEIKNNEIIKNFYYYQNLDFIPGINEDETKFALGQTIALRLSNLWEWRSLENIKKYKKED